MVSGVLWLNFGNGKILWVCLIWCMIVHCGLCYILLLLLLYKYKYKWHTHLPQFGKQLGFCGTQRVTNPVWPIPNPPRRRFSTFLTFPPSFRPFSTSLIKSYFPQTILCQVEFHVGYPLLHHSRTSTAIGHINWLPLQHVSNVDNPSSANCADIIQIYRYADITHQTPNNWRYIQDSIPHSVLSPYSRFVSLKS